MIYLPIVSKKKFFPFQATQNLILDGLSKSIHLIQM